MYERHNMCGTRIYDIWRDMRHRCNCSGLKNYKYYGGRGISVCEEWNNSFVSFYEWAMNNGYENDLTIDRIDVNGNYEPSNCRWVNISVQSANRRNAGKCEYIGVFLHSNGSCYCTQVEVDSHVVFTYSSRSKNECAEKRNEFIANNKLLYPLNKIMDEYEDVRLHKNDRQYIAVSKSDGEEIVANSENELSRMVGLTPQFIWQCLSGKRNSKKYYFKRVELYEDHRR